jgi:hypothetical protein
MAAEAMAPALRDLVAACEAVELAPGYACAPPQRLVPAAST